MGQIDHNRVTTEPQNILSPAPSCALHSQHPAKRTRALRGRNPARDSRIRRVNRLARRTCSGGLLLFQNHLSEMPQKIPGVGAEPQRRHHTASTPTQSYHLALFRQRPQRPPTGNPVELHRHLPAVRCESLDLAERDPHPSAQHSRRSTRHAPASPARPITQPQRLGNNSPPVHRRTDTIQSLP